jgi:RND family efflux transporter MFP subunit
MRRYMALLMLTVMIASGCGGAKEPEESAAVGAPVPVEAVRVETQFAEEPIQYSATVEPSEEATIASKIMGRVERVRVSEGESVRKGDLLVKLHGEDVRARLAQARAGVAETTAHFENAKKNLERFEALYDEKASTQKELDDVRMAYESARARLEAAREMELEVEELMRHVEIVAPFDGVVTKTYVDAGDLATPGRPILTIENARQLEIVASVPESQIEHLSIGMPVKIVIPAGASARSSDEILTGTIDQIVPSADPGSHQFEVKAFIANPGGSVMSGMFARLVVSRALTERLMVPSNVIFSRGQLEGLFVVGDDGRARLRWVRTGREIGDMVEVLAGLDPGETVVTESASQLRDGQAVEVID